MPAPLLSGKYLTAISFVSDYEQYGYDNDGNLTSKRLRSGDTVSFTYDNLSRLTEQSFASGASQPTFWGYDLLNDTLFVRTQNAASGPGISFMMPWDRWSPARRGRRR
jgi:YD repeat-containing protein